MVWIYHWFKIQNEEELLKLLERGWEYQGRHPIYPQSIFLKIKEEGFKNEH